MDILKKLRNGCKHIDNNVGLDQPVPQMEEVKSVNVDSTNAEIEDDEDDFIMNEVKRRLKELRRNSFMVLIPEETSPADEEEEEDEDEGETSSREWRDVEAEGLKFWSGFGGVYDTYCERMLFFDRSSSRQLLEAGSRVFSSPSPRSASKKLASPLRCLSLRKFEASEEEVEHLPQPIYDAYYDLETAYVAQVSLTWEALHCQYIQFCQKIAYQPDSPTSYNDSAEQFQQFQVLLQRFIENEPFQPGLRSEIYARARKSLPKLLQVPKIQASEKKHTGSEEASSEVVVATDFIRIMENSILSFHQFIKVEKKKPAGGARNIFGSPNQIVAPAQQIQLSLEKKTGKLKDLWKRNKNYKKKCWPSRWEDAEMLLALIDTKVLLRVARMPRISKEQLFWCEEKMKKLVLCNGKLQRDPSPILFPCV